MHVLCLSLCSKLLAAYSMPSFTVEMKNVRAREGDKAKFKCIYAGNPAPGKW